MRCIIVYLTGEFFSYEINDEEKNFTLVGDAIIKGKEYIIAEDDDSKKTVFLYDDDSEELVLVEDKKSAASAALLGDLGSLTGGVGGKSPADAEIEILNSRLILGQTIKNLNLDILINDDQDGVLNRLVTQDKVELDYTADAVIYHKNQSSFSIHKLDVTAFYQDKPLILQFINQNQNELDLIVKKIIKNK